MCVCTHVDGRLCECVCVSVAPGPVQADNWLELAVITRGITLRLGQGYKEVVDAFQCVCAYGGCVL